MSLPRHAFRSGDLEQLQAGPARNRRTARAASHSRCSSFGLEAFPAGCVSAGHQIQLDIVRPRAAAAHLPAILIYHGCTGIERCDDRMDLLAHELARRGFAAVGVHYFDRTGTKTANLGTVLLHSEKWIQAVTDCLTFTVEHLGADGGRVGTFGYSLGGFLAVAHAARDVRVRASVVVSGGIDPFTSRSVRRLPSMLLLHGEEDRRVPVAKGARLCRTLAKLGTPFQRRLYPGEGHIFSRHAFGELLKIVPDFFEQSLRRATDSVKHA